MTAISTSSPSVKPPVNEYNLEGNLLVRDKTNGVAKATFRRDEERGIVYDLSINGKKLIYPTQSDAKNSSVIFFGSQKITFKLKGEFVKITEIDAKARTVLYVDTRNCVENIAYDLYKYLPKELSLEEATDKLKNLASIEHFKPMLAAYNRHGVAVFGWNAEKGNYALCWANPNEEQVKEVNADCTRFRDGGTSIAKSQNGAINFRFLINKGFYMNAEPAKEIKL